MRIIGLTGGIGTGKSTVSEYLQKKGCQIIDADKISRELTAPNGEALPKIREYFGDEYFAGNGMLDRKKLASRVFSNVEDRLALEKITTEVVIQKTKAMLDNLKTNGYDGIVIVDAPLLFECNMKEYMDETWLVTADLEVRLDRVYKRDTISKEEIQKRIDNQMPDSEKIKLSDFVIYNSSDLSELYAQIDKLYERLV